MGTEKFIKMEADKMTVSRITPEPGKIYTNKCGSDFLCLRIQNGIPIMRNIRSGWTVEAHNVWQNEKDRKSVV